METVVMKIDDLNEKRISLGKCIINETNIPGIYQINNTANVAAIGPNSILAGDITPDDNEHLTLLNRNLLEKEVALIKEYVFGAVTAYKIVDLSAVKLPSFMAGENRGGSIWPEFF